MFQSTKGILSIGDNYQRVNVVAAVAARKTNSRWRRNVLINIDWLKRGARSVSPGAKVPFRASNNQRRMRRKAVQPSDKIESNDTPSNYYFDRRAVRTSYAAGEKNRGIESHIRPAWLMAFDRTDSTPCLPVSRISFCPRSPR